MRFVGVRSIRLVKSVASKKQYNIAEIFQVKVVKVKVLIMLFFIGSLLLMQCPVSRPLMLWLIYTIWQFNPLHRNHLLLFNQHFISQYFFVFKILICKYAR